MNDIPDKVISIDFLVKKLVSLMMDPLLFICNVFYLYVMCFIYIFLYVAFRIYMLPIYYIKQVII
ncbi:hypothetical protein [Plasmodium yoelii yoelii]|uniref:Uncharacterized protein n=1 Tax=Plasmodium yoelii yoelii TaxID=73239 RepID=Q7RE66_PLAYO|nr:hypothetical protein [Plasmodium yoelii yoelii]